MSKREPTELERFCEARKITCDVKHVRLVTKANDTRVEWPHDEWEATLRFADKSHDVPSYKSGLGHRKAVFHGPGGAFNGPSGDCTKDIAAAAERGWTKPVPPTTGDIVGSLVMDASGADESFSEWCSSLGYSDDSIKARATYDACQRTRDALLRMFGRELFEELAAAEH